MYTCKHKKYGKSAVDNYVSAIVKNMDIYMNITTKLLLTCLIVFLFTLKCELEGIFEDRNDINLPGKVIYEGEDNIEYPRILNSDSILFSESKYGELGCYSTEVKILSLIASFITVLFCWLVNQYLYFS